MWIKTGGRNHVPVFDTVDPNRLTGCPKYQAGLSFSALDRLKVASISGSYMTLSIKPWDSG